MINRKMLFVAAITSAIGFSLLCNNPSSSDGDGYDVGPDFYEPDPSRVTAKTISTAVQNRVLLPGDTDWVEYTVTPGDSIVILTTGTTDTKIALFSISGIAPEKQNDDISTTNTNACVAMSSVNGGLFYICVTGKTESVFGSYTLQVLSANAGTLVDSFENDNSKATATLITDTIFSGHTHIITMNDTDWISFPVLAGFSYTVSALSISGYYLTMIGYRSNDSLIDSRISFKDPSITFTLTQDDTVYFCILSNSNMDRYSISMNRCLPDAYENDNTRALAKLKTDTVLNAEVHSLSVADTDWVAFPVIADGSYSFTISSTSDSITTFYYRANDSVIDYRTGTSCTLSYTPLINDTIYVRMNATVSIPSYTISMSSLAPLSPDSYESDNDMSTAKILPTDNTVQTRNLIHDDFDYVSFSGNAGDKIVFSISQLVTNKSIIFIYDSLGNPQQNWICSNEGVTFRYDLSRTGIYYIGITRYEHNVSRYTYTLAAVLQKNDTIAADTSITRRFVIGEEMREIAVALDSGNCYSFQYQVDDDRYLEMRLSGPAKLPGYPFTTGGKIVSFSYNCIQTGIYLITVATNCRYDAPNFTLTVTKVKDSVTEIVDTVAKLNISSFFLENGLLSGGELELLSDGSVTGFIRGAWGRDGNILYISEPPYLSYTGIITGETVSGRVESVRGWAGTWSGTWAEIKK